MTPLFWKAEACLYSWSFECLGPNKRAQAERAQINSFPSHFLCPRRTLKQTRCIRIQLYPYILAAAHRSQFVISGIPYAANIDDLDTL